MGQRELSSKSLLKLIEHFEDDNFIYLVYPWSAHCDVGTYLKQFSVPYLTERELQSPMKQLIKGINDLHKIGLLHNDIQLDHILLARRKTASKKYDQVKLCSYSQACPVNQAAEHVVRKKTLYTAPEVLKGFALSEASDIWSLGVTIYVLAMGAMPFSSPTQAKTTAPSWSSKVRSTDLQPELKALVSQMLQKDPAARPSVAEILASPFLDQ